MRLGDGRGIGVAEFGPATGAPILWFHGTPGARRQVPPRARELARERKLRILGIERPGIGWSSPHVYPSVLDWARDIEELTEQLGIDEFGVVGLSGGGPYVLSCAHHMPDRVVAAALFGCVAPTSGGEAAVGGFLRGVRPLHPLMRMTQGALGLLLSAGIRALHPVGDQVFDLYLRLGPSADRELLRQPDMREMFIDDLKNGTREGSRSLIYDLLLFMRPWGFSLRELRVPTHFWQGDSDAYVPFSHGTHLASLIPNAGLTLRAGEGHLGGLAASEEALDFILEHWPRGARNSSSGD